MEIPILINQRIVDISTIYGYWLSNCYWIILAIGLLCYTAYFAQKIGRNILEATQEWKERIRKGERIVAQLLQKVFDLQQQISGDQHPTTGIPGDAYNVISALLSSGFKTVAKDDSSPVRAAAAKQLAHDPDPGTAKALVKAAADKNWQVRAAALEAIAQRNDPLLVPKIAAALEDEKDVVRFTAAACVAHLSKLAATKSEDKTTKQ